MKFSLPAVMMLSAASIAFLSMTAEARGPRGKCAAAALLAAENDYGNDPTRTQTKELIPGRRYAVTVGIDNPEDGPHNYIVTFPNGICNPQQALVKEVKWY